MAEAAVANVPAKAEAGEPKKPLLGLVDLVHRLAEHFRETRRPLYRLARNRFLARHGLSLHGTHFQHQAIEFDTLAHDFLHCPLFDTSGAMQGY